jgi:hypothetical protein
MGNVVKKKVWVKGVADRGKVDAVHDGRQKHSDGKK